MTQAGSPDPRNDRVCITSLCPRQFLWLCLLRQLCRRQQLRLLEPLAAHHHGPGHACDFVSKRNGSNLDRPTVHQTSEPGPLRAVLARISDDSHRAGRRAASASVDCPALRSCRALFASGRMLSRAPSRSTQRDCGPTKNTFQSPTSATSAVATIGPTPGISSSRRLSSLDRCQAWMRFSMATISALTTAYWRARMSRLNRAASGMRIILLVSDDLEQLCRAIAALCGDNAELGHMPADRIRQHRSLTNQKAAAAMQHQARLLLLRLRRHKSHRRPRDRLADCGSVVGIVLAALNVGLHVARRHQPHRVPECLKPAAPIMCGRTCLNADEAGRQRREELQQLRSADALPDHYRATGVHAVNLKTDFAISRPIVLTSPMDGAPSSGSFRRTTLWHLDAAEWAPSTASFANRWIHHGPSRHVRFAPKADIV